jgi:DNA polymerase-3 subunit gamma/tau
MYQALYRKWRPRTFDDVVGQEHITETLKKQVETGRLSHAYLFIGTRGTGKTTCAKILARAVNCEHPVNGNPCNQCPSCRGIESGGILDVVELDAASNNRVDDVRALQDEAIFSPATVKKRVYIIDEVHMLSTAAFNALLKILEEPPAHLMFILCTTELHKVLPTIVSRCQRHSFKRIEPDAIAGRLSYVAQQEGMDLDPEAAALLARLADGGMRDALSLLDQCSASEHIDVEAVHAAMGLAGNRRIAQLLDAIAQQDVEKTLALFDQLWKDGKDPAGILEELGDLMRDVLLLQVAPKGCDSLISGLHDKKTLQYFAAKFSGSTLMDSMDAIRRADLGGSNPRRVAEMCLVTLCVPETGDSLAALKSRISHLELALQNGVPMAQAPVAEAPAPAAYAPLNVKSDAAPAPKEASAPPPPMEDDIPWYTDEDAPPEEPSFMPPPVEDVTPPAQPEPKPEPARPKQASPAPAAQAPGSPAGDTQVWDELVQRLNGKLDLWVYPMLTSGTQCLGQLQDKTMTIHLFSPLVKTILNTPSMVSLLQEELYAITGDHIQVAFTDGPVPAPAAPDTSKLDALSKFSNITFE